MITIEDTSLVLFRLHDTKIYTNTVSSETALRHENCLGFSLINVSSSVISFEGAQNACIMLSFLLGESSECLFPTNTAASDFGTIYGPEPFLPSKQIHNPIKKNKLQMQLNIKDNATFCLHPGEVLSFRWEGMTTTSPEGFSTLTMTFPGVTLLDSVTLTQDLYKECIYANIVNFYASPSGGAPGSRISLHWKAENADSGYILPIGKDVITGNELSDSYVDTTLTQNTHYYLNINNAHGNVYRETYAQLLPPYIAAFTVDSQRKLSWEVYFADKVRLKTDGDYMDKDPTGQIILDPNVSTVSIQCIGLYTLERYMAIPPCAGIQVYQLDIWTFASHQCAILTWQTEEQATREVIVRDTTRYTIDSPACGVFEQVYDKDIPVGFQLHYKDASCEENLFLSNSCFNSRR